MTILLKYSLYIKYYHVINVAFYFGGLWLVPLNLIVAKKKKSNMHVAKK